MKRGDRGHQCQVTCDVEAYCEKGEPCPWIKEQAPERKEYFDEEDMVKKLIVHQAVLKQGGIIWTDMQLDFLRDMCEMLRPGAGALFFDGLVKKWVDEDKGQRMEAVRPQPHDLDSDVIVVGSLADVFIHIEQDRATRED